MKAWPLVGLGLCVFMGGWTAVAFAYVLNYIFGGGR